MKRSSLRRCGAASTAATLVSLVVLACQNPTANIQQRSSALLKLSSKTRVLTSSDVSMIQSVSSDRATIHFAAGGGLLSTLNPGSIMVVGPGPQAPDGLLRKVDSVSSAGGEVTVTTSEAALADAIDEGTVEFSRQLSVGDLRGVTRYARGVSFAPARRRSSVALPFTFPVSNVVLYDADQNPATVDDQIRANGEIAIGATFKIDASFQSNALISAVVEAVTAESVQLSLESNATATIDKTATLASLNFAPLLFKVGELPVVIVPSMTVTLGAKVTATPGSQIGVTQFFTATTGLAYNASSGAWLPIEEQQSGFQCTPPTPAVSGDFSADVFATSSIVTNLYGVAGAIFDLSGNLNLAPGTKTAPWWTLSSGITGEVGVDPVKLSRPLAAANPSGISQQVLNYWKVLAQSSGCTSATSY